MVERSYASGSLARHLARGVVGLGALIGSVALIPLVGPISLVLIPVGLVALRGCPTCWLIGLTETFSRGRLQRSCQDGRCELHVRRVDERTDVDATADGRNGVCQPVG
jgi:hypothetical protein